MDAEVNDGIGIVVEGAELAGTVVDAANGTVAEVAGVRMLAWVGGSSGVED